MYTKLLKDLEVDECSDLTLLTFLGIDTSEFMPDFVVTRKLDPVGRRVRSEAQLLFALMREMSMKCTVLFLRYGFMHATSNGDDHLLIVLDDVPRAIAAELDGMAAEVVMGVYTHIYKRFTDTTNLLVIHSVLPQVVNDGLEDVYEALEFGVWYSDMAFCVACFGDAKDYAQSGFVPKFGDFSSVEGAASLLLSNCRAAMTAACNSGG